MDPNSVCEVFNCNMCHNVCAREREKERDDNHSRDTEKGDKRETTDEA